MTEQNQEQVRNEEGLLAAYNHLKEEIRKISAERDELVKSRDALQEAADNDEWRNRALLAEIKSSLTSRGLKDVERLVPLLGTEGIEFDDEGKVKGLDERLTAKSKEYPELFDPKRRAGGKADVFANEPSEPKVDPLREQVRQALGTF